MKWVLIEVEWNGKEHEMPTKYDKKEDAEKDCRIFLWENPRKGCKIKEIEG